MESKIRATIKNEGDLIGYEDDAETVGPRALAAKRSLLDAIPYIMPQEDMRGMLYRLVLEHGDYGIHNMTIAVDDERRPHVTSPFDWETGFIVPAIFSDPLVTVYPVDMEVDEDGDPKATRLPNNASAADIDAYQQWAELYIRVSH